MTDNIIHFPTPEASTNMECPKCNGQWFEAVVVMDAQEPRVIGFGLPLVCDSCKHEIWMGQ